MQHEQKTREELMIENAILQFKDQVDEMLEKRLTPLTSSIDNLSSTVESHDARLKFLEDIINPFAMFRRKLWSMIIYAVLTFAIISIVWVEIKRLNNI